MAKYLMVGNPGVCQAESFTLLGASTKRDTGCSRTIGQFGSGNKHGVATCLRHGLKPIVCLGNLRMDFDTKPQPVGGKTFDRVFVKYGGKDDNGTSRSSSEDLGFVVQYGEMDWPSVSMALREFVSNAIDACIEAGEAEFTREFESSTGLDIYDNEYKSALAKYREDAEEYTNVSLELVDNVRAKAGHTRVFVPISAEVEEFFENVGKWFLHFSDPALLQQTILPKAARNMTGSKSAVIYRRGVYVREYQYDDASLFDYNLENLRMDESRVVDEYSCRVEASRAIGVAEIPVLRQYLMSFDGKEFWEHQLDGYSIFPTNEEARAKSKSRWEATMRGISANCVLTDCNTKEPVDRKGYSPLVVPRGLLDAANRIGIRTAISVLTADDLAGREVLLPTKFVVSEVARVFGLCQRYGIAEGIEPPTIHCFRSIMNAGSVVNGFQRENGVYFNVDISGGDSHKLSMVVLEELAHYITKATDCSRDFQDFCINFACHAVNSPRLIGD